MQPARHAYGALLLEQGRVEEAEAVYRADLGLDDTLARACQHPGNVWSLHGYHECLTRLGKQRAGRHHRPAAQDRRGARRRAGHRLLRLPADHGRLPLSTGGLTPGVSRSRS